MTKKDSLRELTLAGATLSNDDTLQELVKTFKSELSAYPDIPVCLDLSGLGAIYSKGIAIVLGLFKDCKTSGREFRITISSDDIFNLFKMLKLDKVISIEKVEK